MIGSRYWATGITVAYGYAGNGQQGWSATLTFYDDGFLHPRATQGTLGTRRSVPEADGGLTAAIDVLKADAERLGIEFRRVGGFPPMLYVPGEGEERDRDLPVGWRRRLAEQAQRLGWESPYGEGAAR